MENFVNYHDKPFPLKIKNEGVSNIEILLNGRVVHQQFLNGDYTYVISDELFNNSNNGYNELEIRFNDFNIPFSKKLFFYKSNIKNLDKAKIIDSKTWRNNSS